MPKLQGTNTLSTILE